MITCILLLNCSLTAIATTTATPTNDDDDDDDDDEIYDTRGTEM